MIKILRAKLHGIRVTGADLNYHGSISLDPLTCKRAGLLPTEFVEIWNKSSGARISTYVIYGTPGSRCCILNGAAAEYVDPASLAGRRQTVLTFTPTNEIASIVTYQTESDGAGGYDFTIEETAAG